MAVSYSQILNSAYEQPLNAKGHLTTPRSMAAVMNGVELGVYHSYLLKKYIK